DVYPPQKVGAQPGRGIAAERGELSRCGPGETRRAVSRVCTLGGAGTGTPTGAPDRRKAAALLNNIERPPGGAAARGTARHHCQRGGHACKNLSPVRGERAHHDLVWALDTACQRNISGCLRCGERVGSSGWRKGSGVNNFKQLPAWLCGSSSGAGLQKTRFVYNLPTIGTPALC